MAASERLVAVESLGPAGHRSPLRLANAPGQGLCRFTAEDVWVRHRVEVARGEADEGEEILFRKAGPCERLFFDPAATRAAVVTCGGLCPGLNNVIRSLFLELHLNWA